MALGGSFTFTRLSPQLPFLFPRHMNTAYCSLSLSMLRDKQNIARLWDAAFAVCMCVGVQDVCINDENNNDYNEQHNGRCYEYLLITSYMCFD